MPTKLTFEAKMENIDQVIRQLEDLKKSLEGVATAGAGAGGAAGTGGIFGGAEQSLKNLSKQINEMSSAQSGLSAFLRSFTEIGRSVNSVFGDNQIRMVQRFRQEMGVLSQSLEADKGKFQRLLNLEKAGGLTPGEQADKERLASSIAQGSDTLRSAKIQNILQTPVIGKASLASIGSVAARGLSTGMTVLAGVSSAMNTGADLFIEAPLRSELATRRSNLAAYEEAIKGDVTRYMLREMGMGSAQGIREGSPFETTRMGLGLGLENVRKLLFSGFGILGDFRATTSGEYYEKELSRREALDTERSRMVFGNYSELAIQRNQVGADTYRVMGEKIADAVFKGLVDNQGIPAAIAAQYTNAAAKMGFTPDIGGYAIGAMNRSNLSVAASEGIMRDLKRMGLPANIQGAYSSIALATISSAMGGAAKNPLIYSAIVDQAAAIQNQGSLSMTMIEAASPLAQSYNSITDKMPGVSNTKALEIAGRSIGRMGELDKNTMGLVGWQNMQILNELGIKNPLDQDRLLTMMGQNYPSAVRQIAEESGKSVDEVSRAFQKGRQASYGYMTELGGKKGANWMLSGRDVQLYETGRSVSDFLGSRKTESMAGNLSEPSLKTGYETATQTGAARKESDTIKAMEDTIGLVGDKAAKAVYDAIYQSFTRLGQEIRGLGKDLGEERKSKVNTGTSTLPAWGGVLPGYTPGGLMPNLPTSPVEKQ